MAARRPPMRVRGYAALYSSALLFAFSSLLVKLASRHYSGLFVSGFRFVIGAALCAAVLAFGYRSLRVARPGLVLARGLFGAASMILSYMAISLTGPGRAALLSNTYPLFVLLFGSLFFKERFEPRVLASIAICTAGAVLVMRDGSGAALSGDLLAIGSALAAGVAVNFVRRASQYDNAFMLYLSPCVFGLPVLAFAPMPEGGLVAGLGSGGPEGILLVCGVGLCAFVAQALMAFGYREVSAASGSVVFYLETAVTVLLGALFAGELFNLRFAAGLLLIVAGLALNQLRSLPSRARAGSP